MGRGQRLADWLYIPRPKQDEIRHNFPDVMEQKKQVINYWINTDPLAGWRRLITALDRIGETQLADLIRSNSESLTGSQVCSKLCLSIITHTFVVGEN